MEGFRLWPMHSAVRETNEQETQERETQERETEREGREREREGKRSHELIRLVSCGRCIRLRETSAREIERETEISINERMQRQRRGTGFASFFSISLSLETLKTLEKLYCERSLRCKQTRSARVKTSTGRRRRGEKRVEDSCNFVRSFSLSTNALYIRHPPCTHYSYKGEDNNTWKEKEREKGCRLFFYIPVLMMGPLPRASLLRRGGAGSSLSGCGQPRAPLRPRCKTRRDAKRVGDG